MRFYPENGEKVFAAADKNGDGVLVHEEYHDLLGHGSLDGGEKPEDDTGEGRTGAEATST